MLRYLVRMAMIAGTMSVGAVGTKAGPAEDPAPVVVSLDTESGNLRLTIHGEAAKTLFSSLVDARSTIATRAGVGTSEIRMGRNLACERFQSETDTTGVSDVYRCGQLVASNGRSVADTLSPMIGGGN